jgi:flagellar hook-length control protein FliK
MTSFVSQAQPALAAHDPAEQSERLMTRSVVFDMAQPDLGHVNIRVAMTNDVVHTHLLADRPEVGQFLINGQDRLQAAFQANGLDMGQFRVDIDRQSAGRSFQHGPSQEESQGWNQHDSGLSQEHNSDRQSDKRASLHGLLNVVA